MGKLGPNLPKFEVFGQLFKFESSNFSDFAYFNRQTWCLDDNGGPVAEKNFEGQIWALFRFVSKLIFSTATLSYEFLRFAYYDRLWQIQVQSGVKKISRPY